MNEKRCNLCESMVGVGFETFDREMSDRRADRIGLMLTLECDCMHVKFNVAGTKTESSIPEAWEL